MLTAEEVGRNEARCADAKYKHYEMIRIKNHLHHVELMKWYMGKLYDTDRKEFDRLIFVAFKKDEHHLTKEDFEI